MTSLAMALSPDQRSWTLISVSSYQLNLFFELAMINVPGLFETLVDLNLFQPWSWLSALRGHDSMCIQNRTKVSLASLSGLNPWVGHEKKQNQKGLTNT